MESYNKNDKFYNNANFWMYYINSFKLLVFKKWKNQINEIKVTTITQALNNGQFIYYE